MKINTLLSTVSWADLRKGFVRMDATPSEQKLEALRNRRSELLLATQALVDGADADNRDLQEDEIETIRSNHAEVEKINTQISAREAAVVTANGRKSDPDPKPKSQIIVPANSAVRARAQDPGKRNFLSFGEFAITVRAAMQSNPDPKAIERLRMAATTYGDESVGAEGGFLVPPDFATAIWQKTQEEESLLARCAQLQTGSNSLTIPKDETTPWQSTGGIQVYWEGEASAIPASKPLFESSTIRLVKLTALIPITEELMEDSVGLDSWLRAKAPAKMTAKINTAVVSGTGMGQPLGILNAPSLITVSKESGPQTTDTIVFPNIVKLWSRMYAPWRRNAIWLINQDIEPQLNALAFLSTAASPVPAYMPANGLSDSPYSTLMGRPVVPVEACTTLGDLGDIILVDLNQYWAITKGGVRQDTSIHLYFDQAVTTFRFIFRLNGQPAWSSVITPQNGTNTRGWAIVLEAR